MGSWFFSASLVFLLIAPAPLGFILRRWWSAVVVAGLAPLCFYLVYRGPDPNEDVAGDGTAWGLVLGLYIILGLWGTATAALGVRMGRNISKSGTKPPARGPIA